jgi:hypothetical protein
LKQYAKKKGIPFSGKSVAELVALLAPHYDSLASEVNAEITKKEEKSKATKEKRSASLKKTNALKGWVSDLEGEVSLKYNIPVYLGPGDSGDGFYQRATLYVKAKIIEKDNKKIKVEITDLPTPPEGVKMVRKVGEEMVLFFRTIRPAGHDSTIPTGFYSLDDRFSLVVPDNVQ